MQKHITNDFICSFDWFDFVRLAVRSVNGSAIYSFVSELTVISLIFPILQTKFLGLIPAESSQKLLTKLRGFLISYDNPAVKLPEIVFLGQQSDLTLEIFFYPLALFSILQLLYNWLSSDVRSLTLFLVPHCSFETGLVALCDVAHDRDACSCSSWLSEASPENRFEIWQLPGCASRGQFRVVRCGWATVSGSKANPGSNLFQWLPLNWPLLNSKEWAFRRFSLTNHPISSGLASMAITNSCSWPRASRPSRDGLG